LANYYEKETCSYALQEFVHLSDQILHQRQESTKSEEEIHRKRSALIQNHFDAHKIIPIVRKVIILTTEGAKNLKENSLHIFMYLNYSVACIKCK